MTDRTRGYYEGDWERRQNAKKTLAMVLVAKKLGVADDPDLKEWMEEEEKEAREDIAHYEAQAKALIGRTFRKPSGAKRSA